MLGGEAASLREAPLPQTPLSRRADGVGGGCFCGVGSACEVGVSLIGLGVVTAADRAAATVRGALLRQYRTNELVRWRMHFLSDAIAEIEGLLEVNRDFCKKQMAEKASPALPTNCAVLP